MHIIFDFDGTIVDSKDQFIQIYNAMAVKNNKPHMTTEIFNKISSLSIFEKLKIFDTNVLEVSKVYHEIEKLNFDKVDDIKLFDGITEQIKKLSENNDLYILSSNSKRIINRVFNNYGIRKYFKDIQTNRNIFGKARSINKIIRTNSLNRSDVIYIGDEERDILASIKAKIKVLAVTWGFDSKELLNKTSPDHIISNPNELYEHIKGMSNA